MYIKQVMHQINSWTLRHKYGSMNTTSLVRGVGQNARSLTYLHFCSKISQSFRRVIIYSGRVSGWADQNATVIGSVRVNPQRRCADPKILSPHQSTDFNRVCSNMQSTVRERIYVISACFILFEQLYFTSVLC